MKIGIVIDSTLNVPDEIENKYDIEVVPLNIISGDKTYVDRIEVSTDDVLTRIENGENITTSQPSPSLFVEAFEKMLGNGFDKILCVTASSGLSGTHQSAQIALEMVDSPNIEIVDSFSAAMIGDVLMNRIDSMISKKYDFTKMASKLRDIAKRSRTILTVDDLRNIVKSGRLTKSQALIGNVLKVKPLIGLNSEGKAEIIGKVRSSKKVLKSLVDAISETANPFDKIVVSIGHVHAKERIDELSKLIKQNFENAVIYISKDITPVVATHIGRGGFGISWTVV